MLFYKIFMIYFKKYLTVILTQEHNHYEQDKGQ